MDHSLVFAGGGIPLRHLTELAVEAEEAGYDGVLTVEAWRSGLVPLAAIATATRRSRVGTYVLNAHLRTPLLAGLSALDLDELSGGRVAITVGTGNPHMNAVWHGLDTRRPAATMEEYVALLRRITATPLGGSVEHEGRFFRCSWNPATAPTRARIPVHLAAMYPRMQQVAGRVADGVALAAFCSADYVREVVRPRVAEAAAQAGRDPADVRVLAATLARVAAPGEGGDAARDAMRRTVCHLLAPPPHPYYEHVLTEQGEAALVHRISTLMGEGRLDAAADCVSDEFLDRFTVAGDADHARTVLASYDDVLDEAVITSAAGVDTTLGHTDPAHAAAQVASYRALMPLPTAGVVAPG